MDKTEKQNRTYVCKIDNIRNGKKMKKFSKVYLN